MNEALNKHFENFIAKRKEEIKRMRTEREESAVSDLVYMSKIAASRVNGYISSPVTPTMGKELVETIKASEVMQDDIDIMPTKPVRRLIPGKMIFLNFPGNGTSLTDNDGNPLLEAKVKADATKAVDSFFDFIDKENTLKKEDFQKVGFYYTFKRNGLIEEFNETGVPHESVRRFGAIFDDLISKDGKKIDVSQAVENMSKVVMRGQCFGTLVVSELEKVLAEKLLNLGYTSDESARILSAPTALFSSSPVALEEQPKYFKVVAYANCADTLIPTIKGAPDYKEKAGFTDEDIKSDKLQIKEIETENYKLLLCSRLDMPETEELMKIISHNHPSDTQYQLWLHLQKAQKGHDFGYVAHPVKDSFFMKYLKSSVSDMMRKPVQELVEKTRVVGMLDETMSKKVQLFLNFKKGNKRGVSRHHTSATLSR